MDSWRYEPTPDFDQPPLARLKNFPRHPDLLVYLVRTVANHVVRTFLRLYHRLEIVGRENLPSDGSFIIVANHASHLDALTLLAALPLRKIHRAFPAAASDYFFTNLTKTAFSVLVVNAMPFDRKENPRQSVDLCRQLLESPGHILVLFPEGTRSPDGTIGRFKPGIGFLVAGTQLPIVPCYLHGAGRAWPKGKLVPRPRKMRLHIGVPRQFNNAEGLKDEAVAVAEALQEAVEALSERVTGSSLS
jgi:1-acyl-sn-glycerol-3-phosphate acyltransferase